MSLGARALDAVMEATVVPSFTSIGPRVRSSIFDWVPIEQLPRLDGTVVLVTGATSGLGEAAALDLARLGASVRLLARNPDKAERSEQRIKDESGNDDVRTGIADLASLGAVDDFADEFLAHHDRLDAIIHNAGALVHERTITEDGIELTVQTHVIAPLLLTRRLMPLLQSSAPARVIWVTSGGMYSEKLSVDLLDQLEHPDQEFNGVTAYARAKRAQVALVRELSLRSSDSGVVFHAMHPGWADTPGVEESLPRFHKVLGPWLRSPGQGADTIVWLTAAPEALESSGDLWLDRRRRSTHKLPWTKRADEAEESQRLLRWCDERLGSRSS